MNAVEVRELSKNYLLEGSQLSRMRHLMGAGKLSPKDGIWALRDVSFSVAQGEAFGIIGTNGSGKARCCRSWPAFCGQPPDRLR